MPRSPWFFTGAVRPSSRASYRAGSSEFSGITNSVTAEAVSDVEIFSAVQPTAKNAAAVSTGTSHIRANLFFNSASPCLFHGGLLFTILFFRCALRFSSRRLRAQELIEIGLHHTIVDLTVFICLAAHILFNIFIGSNDKRRPAVQRFKALSDLGIQSRKILFVFNTLAIRRVGDQETVFFSDGLAPTPVSAGNGSYEPRRPALHWLWLP